MSQIDSYIMFLDWKNQYYQNAYTTQGNLQIHCNLYQITNVIFHRTRTKKNLKIWMETQKTPNSQSNLRKKNTAEGIRLTDFRLYYKAAIIKRQYGTVTKKNRNIDE